MGESELAVRRLGPGHAAAVAAALVAGAFLVLLVFARVEWRGGPVLVARFALGPFLRSLPGNAPWLVAFAAVAAVVPSLRALVWRAVSPPPPPAYADAYHATALGGLAHNLVPGKIGPLAAAWVLSRTADRPLAPALSSQLVSKLLEMGALVACGAAAAALLRAGAAVAHALLAGAALFAIFSAAAVGIALGAPGAAARIAVRFPRAGSFVAALGEGVAGAGGPRRLAGAFALAFLPAGVAALAYAVPLHAFGAHGGAAGGAVLVAVLAFGQLTPGLPVGSCLHWSLGAWAARHLGVAANDAAALAVLTDVAMMSTNAAVGAASALCRRGSLPDLFRWRRDVEGLTRGAVEPVHGRTPLAAAGRAETRTPTHT